MASSKPVEASKVPFHVALLRVIVTVVILIFAFFIMHYYPQVVEDLAEQDQAGWVHGEAYREAILAATRLSLMPTCIVITIKPVRDNRLHSPMRWRRLSNAKRSDASPFVTPLEGIQTRHRPQCTQLVVGWGSRRQRAPRRNHDGNPRSRAHLLPPWQRAESLSGELIAGRNLRYYGELRRNNESDIRRHAMEATMARGASGRSRR